MKYDFDKSLKAIVTRYTSARKLVQTYLRHVIIAWESSGDRVTAADRINNLVEALPEGVRKHSIIGWAEKAGFRFDREAKNLVPAKKKISKDEAKEAIALEWWTCKPEGEYKPFNLAERLASLVKQAEKRYIVDDERDTIDKDLLAAVSTLV